MRLTTERLMALAVALVAVAAVLAVVVAPNGCSHKGPGQQADFPAASRTMSGYLPQPSFAYAQQRAEKTASLADITERTLPSVVNISSTRVGKEAGGVHPFFNDPFFRRFFGERLPETPEPREERGLGSGVIVSADGIILTNNHVVEKAKEIRVTLADRREIQAKVVGADPKSDLAVIELEGEIKDLQPLPFGDSNEMRLGDVVLAIGNPFGVGQTVTMGIVSAKGRANMGIVDYEDFIQTDAAINPGNSGGALVNMAGQLIGINTAILSRTGGYQGIGFAIPSNMAQPIMTSLLKTGKVVRGWLGVTIQELTPEMARAFNLKVREGVLVSDVSAGSPADKGGLKRGDVVVRFNDKEVDSTGKLRNLVAAAGANTKVTLQVARGGERKSLSFELGELPGSLAMTPGAAEEPQQEMLAGLTVANVTAELRRRFKIGKDTAGVVITDVARGSEAARAGLRPGDVVLEVGRDKVSNVDQFVKQFRESQGQVLLLVSREGRTMYLLLSK